MKDLSNICEVELENKQDSEYVGIIIRNGNPKVILPRGYDLSLNQSEKRKDIILLINVLNKYKKRKESRAYMEEVYNLLQGNGRKFPFSSAFWIIKNYEINGLYNDYIHNYKIDKKGNTNWPRTIKTRTPYISENKLIYLDSIVKEKQNNLNNIILLIQKYIVEKCIDNIGWIYPNVHINKGNKLPYSVQACINILKIELHKTNIDNTKQLVRHMIELLQYIGNDKSKQGLKEYKTKYFMNIWEDMLNVVLGNEDVRRYYPKAQWNIDGNITCASNLRPDIILREKNSIYVIDAKYYKYGVTNKLSDLPQSSDISKQLLYSLYIQENYKVNTYDAFILPYKSDCGKCFRFVGDATIYIDKFKKRKVVCILADTKKIMQKYISMSNLDNYKSVVKSIIDKSNFNNY